MYCIIVVHNETCFLAFWRLALCAICYDRIRSFIFVRCCRSRYRSDLHATLVVWAGRALQDDPYNGRSFTVGRTRVGNGNATKMGALAVLRVGRSWYASMYHTGSSPPPPAAPAPAFCLLVCSIATTKQISYDSFFTLDCVCINSAQGHRKCMRSTYIYIYIILREQSSI